MNSLQKALTVVGCTILLQACASSIDELDQWRAMPVEAKEKLTDDDGDGVIIAREKCEQTDSKLLVDNTGCEIEYEESTDLNQEVTFDPGDVNLTFEQKQELADYLKNLAINKQWQFIVQGYTSKAGDLLLNEYLARERIKAVSEYVQSQTGMPLSSITSQLLDGDKVAEYDNAQNFSSSVENDKDQDGVQDDVDQCGNSGFYIEVDEVGCPVIETQEIKKNVTVRFDMNSTEIADIYLPQVKAVADFINTYNAKNVKVVGHASLPGFANYNLSLSAKRAQAVVDMLVSDYGINAEYLEAYGKGETAPVINDESEEANNLNRRVDIVLEESLDVEKMKNLDLLDADSLNRKVTIFAQTSAMASKQKWHIFIMEEMKLAEPKPKALSESEALKEAQDSGW